MLSFVTKKIFGTYSDRELKKYRPLAEKINALESRFANLTQAQCQEQVKELKARYQKGEELKSLLPECFALVRKAAQDSLGQRHFDVQMLGGIALFSGQIAEMKTGEGKTLTATLPLVLYALTGKGAHLVTVNDYLAKRDAEWMGVVYAYLGLSVGVIVNGLDEVERREAYGCDITYGTNNEYGFDYLRDNMKFDLEDYVQREHHFAIVDEVDSILIDEARTPLIISGPAEASTDLYSLINKEVYGLTRAWKVTDNPEPELVSKIQEIPLDQVKPFLAQQEDINIVVPGDYTLEEKSKNIQLTEEGAIKIEERLRKCDLLREGTLYDLENIDLLHHTNQAIKSHYIFKRDVDYVVQNGKVIIVDEFTGRLMEGRRFSEGLHQALEAKERVEIERENQTLASVTFQNYFRKYDRLAGMTGTAETEAEEFMKIYGLGVVVVPTNLPLRRKDHSDVIYKTKAAKQRAIVAKIKELYSFEQPVLVGTASIESSEVLSQALKQVKIPHSVLNAKHHDQEAQIIADAGKAGSVTIATNMAGRGTDIKVGADELSKGGLFILGTERNESRRVDNQLRGRSGRQGDQGESRFFLSLEDDLLRIFGGERIANLMTRLKIEEDEAIEHVLISKAIANSQKKVEAYHFDVRKHLLEYDDVMNKQREIIYKRRRGILGEDTEEVFFEMLEDKIEALLDDYCHEKHLDQWDVDGLFQELYNVFGHKIGWDTSRADGGAPAENEIFDWVYDEVIQVYEGKKKEFGEINELVLRRILLEITDNLWKDHLLSMDHLKEGIGMRGYAQKNPLTEYKKEGFEMFKGLMNRIHDEAIRMYFHVAVVREPPKEMPKREQPMEMIHESLSPAAAAQAAAAQPPQLEPPKPQPIHKEALPGRNDPCYCGSGKKFKHCHGGAHGQQSA